MSARTGVSAPHRAGLASQDRLLACLQPPLQGPRRDFKNRNRNAHRPPERRVGPRAGRQGSSSGSPASPLPARARRGEALRTPPRRPQATGCGGRWTLRKRAAATPALGSSDRRTSGAAPAPAAGSRPGPGASPGGGSAGARRAGARDALGGARGGPSAPGNLGARRYRRPATFLSRPRGCRAPRRPPGAAGRHREQTPRRVPAARPAAARVRGGARGRARAPRSPRPAPAPNVPPPPPVGASARAPAARRLPAVFRRQSCAAASRGAPRGPPPQHSRRPFRPPRGKAQSAAPLFYLPGVFARALARSLALPPLALVFFLSFLLFVPPRGRFFRSRRPRSPARALLPAGLGGAGRPAALPAPLHPRSGGGGGGGGAPRSDSFQYGTGAGRMRPRPPPPTPHPRSSRQPAPLAPHAWRPPAGPPRARPRVFPPG